eukprot:SAG22_NODE_3271_length_1817_cov_1.389988_2_plen_163_part_00
MARAARELTMGAKSLRRLRRTAEQLQLRPAPAPTAVTTLQVSTTPDAELLPEPATHPTPAQRQSFDENGYLVVDDLVDPAALPALLAESRRIVRGVRDGSLLRAEDQARTGIAPHADPATSWAIRGLLSPELCPAQIYADYLCSAPVRRWARGFLRQPRRSG